MALIGVLGDITFAVSRNGVKTFEDLKWNSGTSYAKHDIHLLAPKLELTAEEADDLSFTMYLSRYLGINPVLEINNIERARKEGEVMRLVVGNKIYGERWVITKSSKSLERYDGAGELLVAKVNISLMAYR